MTGGSRSPEYAERSGRMPTLVVVMEVDGTCEPDLDFDPYHVSSNKVFAGSAPFLSQGKQRRYQRYRVMAAQDAAEIIEVERVRSCAVDECRIERTGSPRRAKYERGSGRCRNARGLEKNLCARLRIPCQRHADRIEDTDLGLGDRQFRQLTLVEGVHSLCQILEQRNSGGIARHILLVHFY